MARPRPEPVWFLENWFCTCSKGRPSFFSASLGMPHPLSSMDRTMAARDLARAQGDPSAFAGEFHRVGQEVELTICLIARRSA